ncbi:MAG: patatin-like phospholipase family protein [Bdellovibrionaceae bacterium]|nr:patatin-like phospholipase family protein [Pseudobdellovibrionaceae bacterium]
MAAKKSHIALVLPGAVAKGAFEAGVIDVLIENKIEVSRIVATSSGALNGLAFASAIRHGNEDMVRKKLIDAWVEKGSWQNSFTLNPLNFFLGRGLSSSENLVELMNGFIDENQPPGNGDIQLQIIVSAVNGIQKKIGKTPATSYEKCLHFKNNDFDTQHDLTNVFKTVSAACAFPGLFTPVSLDNLGPCVDGGVVNNAPIKYALKDSNVSRIIVVIPFPAVMKSPASLSGFSFLGHLIEILINERLFRDLNSVYALNEKCMALKKLVEEGSLSKDQCSKVLKEFKIRHVDIIEIRPTHRPKQSAFSGFFHKQDRVELVEEGREAARAALPAILAEIHESEISK